MLNSLYTPPATWLFESYQICSQLYKEVETNNKLGNDYYNSPIDIVNKRSEQGGIRLAGLLNSFFKRGLPSSITAAAQVTPPLVVSEGQYINVAEVSKHVGE